MTEAYRWPHSIREFTVKNEKSLKLYLDDLKKNVPQYLHVYLGGSVESCKALGAVVGTSTTLERLYIVELPDTSDPVFEHFLSFEHVFRALLGNPNSALRKLDVQMCGLGQSTKVAELLTGLLLLNNPKLETLLWMLEVTPEDMPPVGRALALNTNVKHLTLWVGTDNTSGGALPYVLRALTPADRLTPEQAAYQEGKHNKSLRHLSIILGQHTESHVAKHFTQMLFDNSTLECFELSARFDHEEWKSIFDSLKSNKHLQELDLICGSPGIDDAFEDLMEMLQGNFTLKKIVLDQTPLDKNGKSVLVKEMLERNAKLASYLDTLNKRLNFVPPKIGRLFLCGSPWAGKTTLRRSMVGEGMEASMGEQSAVDERTQGIEIQLLSTSPDKHIAIWDLAGQEEYHALHDSHYVFPNMNQACVFLFLYRPFDDAHKLYDREDAQRHLRKQLHYWLTFINSNSKKIGWVLPKVSVVLTHLDRLVWFGKDEKRAAEKYIKWASNIINDLREKFKGRVELHDTIHAVNALSKQHARGVVDHVLQSFDHLFRTLPKVPAACEEMHLVLAKWTVNHPLEAIIRSDKFFELCKDNVKELKALFHEFPEEHPNDVDAARVQVSNLEKNQKAVASYLHDVGCIIQFRESDCIVVNPNWLGQVFLGQLFRPGDETYQSIITVSRNGIVPETFLETILDDFIKDRKYSGFDTGNLIQLMKELELCYEDNSTDATDRSERHYFIPVALSDPDQLARQGRRKLKWKVEDESNSTPVYFGLRLQSTDQGRTFLSPGFFQRFQVHLHEFLHGIEALSVDYEIERNLISLMLDGHEMLIESSGENEDYVDVLVRSYRSAQQAQVYLDKYVVDKLRIFCASRKGCPGVALQEAILRRACVETLTLCTYRKDQAVVKESLKDNVMKNLFESDELTLQIWDEGAYGKSITEQSFGTKIYKHCFPAVPEANLPKAWADATTMLHSSDIENAFCKYRVTISEQTYAISRAVTELESIVPVAEAPPTSSAAISSRLPPDQRIILSGSNQQPAFSPADHDRIAWEKFHLQEMNWRIVHEVTRTKEEILGEMQKAKTEILDKLEEQKLLLFHLQENMKDMQMLHQTRQVTLMEKIDQILGYSGFSKELQEIPRIPYFTDEDTKMKQRLVGVIKIGSPLKLHFMCEDPSKPHYLKAQQGMDLIKLKDKKVYKRLRPLISGSLKLLFILVKAGLHVGAGIGNAIPDFSGMTGTLSLTVSSLTGEALMGDIQNLSSDEVTGALADAWRCIQELVNPVMAQGKIPAVFQLYSVQYKSNYLATHLSSRKIFWVCKECADRAQNAGQLENLNLPDHQHTPIFVKGKK